MTTYTYQTIDPPGSTDTVAQSINDNGQIVGSYSGGGFLDNNGIYTTIDPPGSTEADATDINALGQIVGVYGPAGGGTLGFLYSHGTYTTIDPPGSNSPNYINGYLYINKAGQIVGTVRDVTTGVDHGFLYSKGTYTTLNYSGAFSTQALSINDAGQIVGDYEESNGTLQGFLYSHGTYTTIEPPTGLTTTPVLFYGINAAPPFNGPLTISETTPGDVNTASFFDASNNPVNQGISLGGYVKYGYVEIGESTSLSTDYFFLDGKFLGNTSDSTVNQVITDLKNAYTNDIVNGGNNTAQLAIDDAAIEAARLGVPVSTINEPFFDSAGHLVQKSGSSYTYPTSINKFGTIVGHYQLSNGHEQGFEYSHGTYTPIEFPGAVNTVPLSINDKGQVTGYYETTTSMYGFTYSQGQYTTINPPGSLGTFDSSINNSGQVVGYYEGSTTNHGFVATDPPSPTTAPHQDLAAARLQLVQAMASFSPSGSALTAGPLNQTIDNLMQPSNHLAPPH